MAWDEDLGAEFGNVTDDKKEEILRQIGVAGEKYALANIKRYFKDLGYETSVQYPGKYFSAAFSCS